jgi:hypothetical protein
MPLGSKQKRIIKQRVNDLINLEQKIKEKKEDMRSGDTSPFLLAIVGERATLQTKVIQSLQTTMGMSFYEQACKIIGEANGYEVEMQKKVKGHLFPDVNNYIDAITNSITPKFDRSLELETIRSLCRENLKHSHPPAQTFPDSTVDVYVKTPEGKELLIDITTVKPNKKEFRILKEKTLRWAAYRMSQEVDIDIEPYFAIPYNPEAPVITGTEYGRFSKYYDRSDILVGDELWQKVSGGTCSITDIMEVFSEIGEEEGDLVRTSLRNLW